ncbi:MAG: metallo-mystery pair system four-Cys motif protein [Inhella sp.]
MSLKKSLHLISLTALLSACGGGGDSGPAPAQVPSGPRSINLDFVATSGGTPVRCGTEVPGLGSGAVAAQIKDFRFYVANVQLLKADGTKQALTLGANDDWNLTKDGHTLSLVDLEDGTGACAGGTAAMNARISGTVPAGSYVGVELTVGVPPTLNHTDTVAAPRPLDVAAMAWSWQSGRKFAKIEVTDPAGATGNWTSKTFNVHLGSTGCTGNPAVGEIVSCSAPNRMVFALSSFNPDSQRIAVDLKELLAGNDITRNGGGATGCMSGTTDPECPKVFDALALQLGSGVPVVGGQQRLFKAVAR